MEQMVAICLSDVPTMCPKHAEHQLVLLARVIDQDLERAPGRNRTYDLLMRRKIFTA
jgi:hypothetical protein